MLGAQVQRFETWLIEYFAPLAIHREQPVLGLTEDGAVLSGVVDLLVETANGYWVIDHKSDRIDAPLVAFDAYAAQLGAYAAVLGRTGRQILGVGVHWLRRGEVVLQPL